MNHRRVFIIHGWGGNPSESWLAWLKNKLEAKGFTVVVPAMPDTDHPKIEQWVKTLKQLVGTPDETTYFVGHSIGCQTILRYVASLPENERVGGLVLVAAWIHLTDETWDEDYTPEIAEPWLTTPIDFEKIKTLVPNISVIQSDNDPYVPFSDAQELKEKLGAEIRIEHNADHLSSEDGFETLPSALDAILKISK